MSAENSWLENWREITASLTAAIASGAAAVKWALPVGRRMWAAHSTAEGISLAFGRDAGVKLRGIIAELNHRADICELKHRINEEHLKVGVYVCDAFGKCEYVNKVLADLFGMQAEDMKGYGWLKPVNDAHRVHADWKFAIANGLPYRATYTLSVDAGKELGVYTEAFPVEEDGQVVKYLGVVKQVNK